MLHPRRPRRRLLASLTLAPALLLLHTRMISEGSFLPVLPSPQAPSAGFWPEWQPRVNVEGGRVLGELPSENWQGFFSDRSRQRYREFGWPWGQNVRWQGEKSASRLEDFAKWREFESEHSAERRAVCGIRRFSYNGYSLFISSLFLKAGKQNALYIYGHCTQ